MQAVQAGGPGGVLVCGSAATVRDWFVSYAAEGNVNGRSIRRIGDEYFVEMTRSEAAGWMNNSVWRSLNEELARETMGEPA